MKNLILLFTILGNIFLFGQANQERAKYKIKPVKTVYEKVDRDATFPGGLNNFRAIFSQRFNTNNVKANSKIIKSVVSFIIEKDGTISNIKAVGNNSSFNREAINTIKKINIKWNPALIKREAVRQRFKLPLTMNFE